MTTEIRRAAPTDAATLHEIAAATFGLACPPETTQAAIDDFIAAHLGESEFSRYLADPHRVLFLACVDAEVAGYTMLILGEPTDTDVRRAITTRPTAELSKVYVLAPHHGTGVARELVEASVAAAGEAGAAAVWLGVNQFNPRANRFYEKSGFVAVGTKKFLLGGVWESDFVRERVL